MCSLTLVLICLQQFLRAGANRLFDNWMPAYFMQERGADVRMAGFLASLPQWTGVIGSLVGGVLSDYILVRTGNRRAARNGVAVFTLFGSVLCYLAAYPISNVLVATLVFSVGAFLFSCSSPCAFALTMDVGGRYLAIVFSTMNMAGNLGAFAFISVIPLLKDLGGWNLALGVFVGMHVVAALCWLAINPDNVIGETSVAQGERAQ
jgi:ACS family glucarate transporter-like MFS transporter